MPDLDEKFQELTIEAFHDGLLNGTMTAAELVEWYLAMDRSPEPFWCRASGGGDGEPSSTRRGRRLR